VAFPVIRHILVDLDGTLLGNRALPLGLEFVARSLRALRPQHGLRLSLRGLWAIQKEIGAAPSEQAPPTTNDLRVLQRFAQAMGLTLEQSRHTLRQGLLEIFPRLERHFYPMPGAREFLDWAYARYPLVLATNPVWPPEIIEMRVKWAGIDPARFRSITHIRTMTATKPSAGYYRQILSTEGFDPAHTLLIGNDAKMDLPATRVGITVFLVEKKPLPAAIPIPHAEGRGWRGSFGQLRELLERATA
jgi:FMN phosphatase YigB (HAD superfamily)